MFKLVATDALGRSRPDQLVQRRTGRVVAVLLGSFEAFGVDRQDGNPLFLCDPSADGLDVVADDAHDAGRVDEGGLGLVVVDQVAERLRTASSRRRR